LNNAKIIYPLPKKLQDSLDKFLESNIIGIDINGKESFFKKALELLSIYKELKGIETKIEFYKFSMFFFRRAKMWLDLLHKYVEETKKLESAIEIEISGKNNLENIIEYSYFLENISSLHDEQLDSALDVLKSMVKLLVEKDYVKNTALLWEDSVASMGGVIPFHQRRPLLCWSIEHALPSVYCNKIPMEIDDYIYQ